MLIHNTQTPDIETASEDYARRFSGPIGKYFLDVQQRYIAEALRSLQCSEGARILEVGGGHAQLTGFLLEQGYQVCVQGSGEAAFVRLKSGAFSNASRLSLSQSSLWQLPFADNEFDVVIAVRLLAHVEKWTELLKEMGRVAKLGLIVDFASISAVNRLSPLLFGAKRKIEGNTRPYFSYSRGQLDEALQGLKFEVCYAKGQFFFPMALHRLIRSPALSRGLESTAAALGLSSGLGSPVILAARPIAGGKVPQDLKRRE